VVIGPRVPLALRPISPQVSPGEPTSNTSDGRVPFQYPFCFLLHEPTGIHNPATNLADAIATKPLEGLVTEYVEGETLRQWMEREPLSPR